MATIVNTPPAPESNASNGMGFLIGVLVLILAGFLFFYYALPAMRNAATTTTAPSVSVPDEIDVNVTTPSDNAQPAQ